MVYYELVKGTIDAPGFAEVIIKVIVRYHRLPDLIVIDQGLLFTSRFWSLLCYFLVIKQKLSTAFHPQMDGQTKKQNSTMKAYLQAFVNFEQNDWTRFLSIAEVAYNNTKNASTGHTSFERNYRYHPCIFYEKNFDLRSILRTAEKLSFKL